MAGERILLVDDDASLLRVTEKQLADAGYEVTAATGGEEALAAWSPDAFDLVLTDVQMPGMDGLELLAEIVRRDPSASVVVITAYGTVDAAVKALKGGAVEFLEKPFRREVLLVTVERALAYRRLASENIRLRLELSERHSFENIIGGSEGMKEVFRTMGRVARSDVAVLLTGESGTGKELVARAVHHAGDRAGGPFVAVNCAAIPETMLEAELFGHEKGAFTGAVGSRRGVFEQAHRGTLFLDEIGEMKPDLQARLLRVLEDGEVRPVGGEAATKVDVRVVAATNRDLAEAIEAGEFREDLYYRLAVVTIDLPPLRDRGDDVLLLAHHFLAGEGAADVEMSRGFSGALLRYRWPGNVRELLNVIRRALVLRKDPAVLDEPDLPPAVREGEPHADPLALRIPEDGISLAEVEKRLIRQALEKTGGNRTQAARLLDISRQTLLYRMEKHGLR